MPARELGPIVFATDSTSLVLSRALQRGTLRRLARGICTGDTNHSVPDAGVTADGALFVVNPRKVRANRGEIQDRDRLASVPLGYESAPDRTRGDTPSELQNALSLDGALRDSACLDRGQRLPSTTLRSRR